MARPAHLTQRFGTVRGVIIALLCWILLSVLHLFGAFDSLDLRFTDWRYRIRGERVASDSIVLVEIDDSTIEAYGRWPLSRDTYALLINVLTGARARTVGFDLLFLGNDLYDARFDLLLAQVSESHDNVVHAVTFLPYTASPGEGDVVPLEVRFALERHAVPANGIPVYSATGITVPFTELLSSSQVMGHVLVAVDKDGVIRRLPMFVRYGDYLFPSLSLAVLGVYEGNSLIGGVESVSGGVEIQWSGGRRVFLPVDAEGATSIDFAGDRGAFPNRYSMLEVLQWYTAGDYARLEKTFGGRIVLIGSTAVGQVATDVGSTPFSTTTPLLLVHANALDALFNDRFLVRPSPGVYLPVLAALTIVIGMLLATLSLSWALGIVGICVAGIAGLNYLLFAAKGIDFPLTVALLLPPLAYTAIETYQYVFLQRRARERQKELDIAREIQRKLLPAEPPDTPELDVYGVNIPAQEVGGDYYDWVPIGEDSLVVTLGDVSGKGVAAAILMSHLRATLHAEIRASASVDSMVQSMNVSLLRATEPERFATLFLASISRRTNELHFCNAGHNPPLLIHEGSMDLLPASGVPLGVFDSVQYKEDRRPFERGDILVLYSDGITECPWKDQMYEDERLHKLVGELAKRSLSASEIGRAILDDVRSFCHGQPYADDVTLVVVRRL